MMQKYKIIRNYESGIRNEEMIPIYIGRGKSILHIKTPDFHYSGGDMNVNIASSINTRWHYGCNYRTLNK
jgi:hypothetical protein